MACKPHRHSNLRRTRGRACHAEAHRDTARRRVLCFECYRARLDRPERLRMSVLTFPRVLTEREMRHRRRMLEHLEGVKNLNHSSDTTWQLLPLPASPRSDYSENLDGTA